MTGKYFLIKICFTLKTSFLCQKYVTSHLIPDDFAASAGRIVQHFVIRDVAPCNLFVILT